MVYDNTGDTMTMDAATAERLDLWDRVFRDQEGVEGDDYEDGLHHCWSCDAVKPSKDAACSCDDQGWMESMAFERWEFERGCID